MENGFIQMLSRSYPDFFQKFLYPDFLENHVIQIIYRFYQFSTWIKGHGRHYSTKAEK